MGITELLTIVFVVLKLVGVVHWNWVVVLMPEIIMAVIYTCFIGAVLIHSFLDEWRERKTDKDAEQDNDETR